MRRVVERDAAALTSLFDKHNGAVFGLLLRILRNRADAEEVMIEVFQELWHRADRFDADRSNVLSYLALVARSRGVDRLRADRSRSAAPLDARYDVAAPNQIAPADAMDLDEQSGKVRGALRTLPVAEREAIESAYFDGLSQTEIARKLNRPLGTVKTQIRQGLIRLRSMLRISEDRGEIRT